MKLEEVMPKKDRSIRKDRSSKPKDGDERIGGGNEGITWCRGGYTCENCCSGPHIKAGGDA